MRLFPSEYFPLDVQPLIAFAAAWIIALGVLYDVPPSKHRSAITWAAAMGFAFYWIWFAIGLPMGRVGPYFGRAGLGDETLLVLILFGVYQSFHAVELYLYRREAFCPRYDLTFEDGEPRLKLTPSLATAAKALPVEPDLS